MESPFDPEESRFFSHYVENTLDSRIESKVFYI